MSAAAPKPPAKLSALLALAIGDMERMLADSRYQPDSGEWHRPHGPTGRCHACLAGAVVAGTLGASPDQDLTESMRLAGDHVGESWWDALRLVDAWRGGRLAEVEGRVMAFGGRAAVTPEAVRAMSDILQDRAPQHSASSMPGRYGDIMLSWSEHATARDALDVLRAEVARLAEAGL